LSEGRYLAQRNFQSALQLHQAAFSKWQAYINVENRVEADAAKQECHVTLEGLMAAYENFASLSCEPFGQN